MKVPPLLRWTRSVFPSRTLPSQAGGYQSYNSLLVIARAQSSVTPQVEDAGDHDLRVEEQLADNTPPEPKSTRHPARSKPERPVFPSTLPSRASTSARLAALHARLALPPRLPIQTLARCLIDKSADPHPDYNNTSLAILGSDFLGYLTSEAILCRYPRLPTEVVFSANTAYIGPKTLATVTKEWGVETVHAPGGEVDAGLLQFRRREAGNTLSKRGVPLKEVEEIEEPISSTRPNAEVTQQRGWRRGVSSRTIYEDVTGQTIPQQPTTSSKDPESGPEAITTTFEHASAQFIRALVGGLYLHTGLKNAKNFYMAHLFSRHLDISSLFSFRQPTRDLSRLCAREGFDRPLARLLSETGRKSRSPTFLVGIFSGREKLGESSGASLDEARTRAAIAALKGWYLYSPLDVRVPSDAIGRSPSQWKPLMIDEGEIIV